ncbi:DUF58 domain-containing protein [Nocardioides sp. Soil805]|uniref:DUF58 domain-containing protein n=1 Tax=Nocardioides sp. Soil805 TaxID=1736416 RepID=UPI000B1E1E03|nr:DUF58 domain-containing protein [Nocardioides sp. Soil805]
MLSRALAVLRVPTATGRGVLLLGLAAYAGSLLWGLVELRLVAVMCLGVLVAAVPWLLVPTRVDADLRLRPPRTSAGESTEASLTATNRGVLPLWQPLLRLPVGDRDAWVRMPSLDRGATERAEVLVDDLTRGVLQVGPATAIRADPLGLLHRPVRWGRARELFVRPTMVVVPSLGSGHVRDLEGTPSDRISMSDLAFHALREYVPGDDLRHVHWRSSARAGELLVRQYHDTRRNHATVVVDADPAAYPTGEGFELAASVAASLLMCAAREEYEVSLACGSIQLAALPAPTVLDGTCRIDPEPGTGTPSEQVVAALALAPETSVLLLVTGAGTDLEALGRATTTLPAETRVVVLRAAPGEPAGVVHQHGHDVVTVGRLAELPGLMAATS